METADAEDMAVAGHVPLQVGIEGALDGQVMIAHGEEYWKVVGRADSMAVEAVIEATRAAGAWVTPNLSAIDRILAEAADLPALLGHPEAAFVGRDRAVGAARIEGPAADRDGALFTDRPVPQCLVLEAELR